MGALAGPDASRLPNRLGLNFEQLVLRVFLLDKRGNIEEAEIILIFFTPSFFPLTSIRIQKGNFQNIYVFLYFEKVSSSCDYSNKNIRNISHYSTHFEYNTEVQVYLLAFDSLHSFNNGGLLHL